MDIMRSTRKSTINSATAWLPLVSAACSAPPEREVVAGSLDQGCKPRIGLELTLVGERVEAGTFSIMAPQGSPSEEGVHYPIQVLSQVAGKLSFRVDLVDGHEQRPFFWDASLVRQGDGTLHAWIDQQGANTSREHLGEPMILRPMGK